MVSCINFSIITNPKAQDFSTYSAKQPYSSNSISFCFWVPFIPFLMCEWSRNAIHIFMSISTFKDIKQSCLSPLSAAKLKLGTGVHVHRCIWCNILYQHALEGRSNKMKLESTINKQQKKCTWNIIWNCSDSIYVLLQTFSQSINQDKAEIIPLSLFSGKRNANSLYIKIPFWAPLETYVSCIGFFYAKTDFYLVDANKRCLY